MCEECGGIQRRIMLLSSQNVLNSGVVWLPWLSRTRSLLLPTVFCLVCFSKCWIHWKPIWSVVQPFGLTVKAHVEGRPWWNHVWFSCFPLKTRNGGIVEPSAQAPWINVTHCVLVGLTCFGLHDLLASVTTFAAEIWPIWKPVSSKL